MDSQLPTGHHRNVVEREGVDSTFSIKTACMHGHFGLLCPLRAVRRPAHAQWPQNTPSMPLLFCLRFFWMLLLSVGYSLVVIAMCGLHGLPTATYWLLHSQESVTEVSVGGMCASDAADGSYAVFCG